MLSGGLESATNGSGPCERCAADFALSRCRDRYRSLTANLNGVLTPAVHAANRKEASLFAPQRRLPPGNLAASAEIDAVPRGVGKAGGQSGPPFRALIPPFHVRVAERDGLRVVEVEGEIDILTAPRLAVALGDHDGRAEALVLGLAKVPFVSSSGLRLIVASHRGLSRRRGLALAGVQSNVAHVLEIVGLASALLMAADVPAAIRLLAERDD